MRCVIFANGEIKNYKRYKQHLTGAEYIICADGGAKHAVALNLIPNLITGDFDSIDQKTLDNFLATGSQIMQYPTEKDEVDTELALIEAIKLNPKEILLMGVVGDRLDHTLGNIQLLVLPVSQGIDCYIISDRHIISLITPDCPAVIAGEQGDLLSLLPMTQTVCGVVSQGLKWNLQDSTFKFGHPLGISNVLLGNSAEVRIKEGVMLLIRVSEEASYGVN